MRILIDGRLYGLENAGLGRYIVNLVEELSESDSKNKYIILLRKKYFEELELPSNWEKVLTDFRHYSLSEQIKLSRVINSINPDIVHFPHFNVPLLFRGKYIVTIHDMLMHKFNGLSATTLPAPFYFFKQFVYKIVFKRAVYGAEKIIVPSLVVKNEIVDYYKIDQSKIEVVYEGFDQKISSNGKSKIQKPYFVYAGNAYPHKNLKRLIEAIIILNEDSDQKIRLAIASARNVFTKKLEIIVEKLKAQKYVNLLGFVPDEDLGSLYKNAVAFVFPSLSEGFGLPGLEAMSCGTIVLVSDIPVFREIYGIHAEYFNPLDFSAIEIAMKNVLEMSQKERGEKIELAKNFAKRYSWSKMAKQTLYIYEKSFKTTGSNSIRQG